MRHVNDKIQSFDWLEFHHLMIEYIIPRGR